MSGQVGWKSEGTYGTGVTVDTFVPVLASNVKVDEGYMFPAGIRAGRRTNPPGLLGKRTISGSLEMELPNVSIAALLKHLMGTVNTTGSGPYTHAFTPGAALGDSLTLQTGVADITDTVQPFTAVGVKPQGWELSCAVGEFAKLKVDWTGRDMTTGTALASASYTSGIAPFTFVQASVSVGGTPVATARSVSLKAAKGLRADRHVLGSRLINQQLEEERFVFDGSIVADFESLTLYNLAAAATSVALSIVLNNGTDTLTVAATIQITGDAPSLTKNGLEEITLNYMVGHASSDATALTMTLVNSEASAA